MPVFGFFDSSTWASSLYVIAEAESTWLLRNRFMSNGCWTIVTPWFLSGSMPAFVSAAKSSYWFPPSQFATFLPFIFAIEVMPELFHVSCVIPSARRPARC